MENIFYKVDSKAFFLLSKALKKERPTFRDIQEILLGLKAKLKNQPIPMTAEQLKQLEDMGIICEISKEEFEQEYNVRL